MYIYNPSGIVQWLYIPKITMNFFLNVSRIFYNFHYLAPGCPQLPAPLNGNVVMDPNDATIGAEVTYSCDDGYVISGQRNRVCQANKTWSATEPTCIESRVEG